MKNVLFKGIGNVVCGIGSKAVVWGKKRSPELLMIAGLGAVGGAFVLALKNSRKGNDILDAHKSEREEIREEMETEEDENGEEVPGFITEEEGTKLIAKSYASEVVNLAKVYAPAITLGVAGIICIMASNNIIKKRNANLVLAYNALEKGFESYRNRVKNEFGSEVEEMIHYDLKKVRTEEEVVDENGKKKKVKKDVTVKEGEHVTGSAYDVLFCEYTNKNFEPGQNVYNLGFVLGHRNSAQWEIDKSSRGVYYLVDSLRDLGYELTKEQRKKLDGYGWENGDYVDFGVRDDASEATRRFIDGIETECLLLSFNAKRLY